MSAWESPRTVRPDPPMTGDERTALRGWLDYHRATLAWKCDGLGTEDLRRQPVSPSGLSLLGLVRHLAEVERHWFRRVVAGETVGHVWSGSGDFQAAYDVRAGTRDEAFAAWTAEVESSRRVEAGVADLEQEFEVESWGCRATLRTLMLHLIHDYARHNGHADLLREAVDGETGA